MRRNQGPAGGMGQDDMTTNHEFEEILRRALHAEVEAAEPVGDGLQRIRHRLEQPRYRLQISLWLTETADLIRMLWLRLEPAALWVRDAALAARASLRRPSQHSRSSQPGLSGTAGGRPRHGAAHRSRPPGRVARLLSPAGPAIASLRPALAVAAAVVIVVAGVFALAQLPENVTGVSSLLTGGSEPSPSAHSSSRLPSIPVVAPGIVAPSPGVIIPSPQPAHSSVPASPGPSCTPSAGAGSPSPSAGTGSPSPSATASPTASGSVSPSGSPSPAGSTAAAAAVATPSPSASSTGSTAVTTVKTITGSCYSSAGTSSPATTATP